MKPRLVLALLAGTVGGIIILVSGCCICWGWRGQEQYERTESFSAAMEGVERISVDTSFGDIKIIGADTNDCNVIAVITGQAPTAEEAKQLAEQTRITLETDGNTLVVKVDKPHLKRNRSIGISYDIVVLKQTGIKCQSSYGYIKIVNIEGAIESHTSYGDVIADNITGRMQLETSYGDVDCKQITSSDFTAKSSFGDIAVDFSDICPEALKAGIKTSYGDIVMDAPSNFAGDVSLETSFGKIRTEVPITVKGEFGKDHLKGTIGEGAGKLDLKTSFGSVTIK
ncbi:MAG: DUF4097 family beta strand repeat-containing protein [Planctomycetota bacterium]